MNHFPFILQTWRALARRHRARLVLLAIILVLLALTTLRARAQEPEKSGARELREMVPEGPVLVHGPVRADLVGDPVDAAVAEYRRTGAARTIRQSSAVVYPFGHAQPTLTCAPLRACVIELQEGERLLSVIAGDTERWLISEAYAGEGGATPLVVVKPTGHDLTTNLVLATDRRLYELTLDAPPQVNAEAEAEVEVLADGGDAATNPQVLYTRRIRFYYPDEMVRLARQEEIQARRAEAASIPVVNPDFRLDNLNFDYRWMRGEHFPFDLEQVFDDGAHTYIKLPRSARHDVAPVLFVTENGERQILNYAVRPLGDGDLYYVTDRAIRQGVLVVGTEKKNWLGRRRHREARMTIVNLDR